MSSHMHSAGSHKSNPQRAQSRSKTQSSIRSTKTKTRKTSSEEAPNKTGREKTRTPSPIERETVILPETHAEENEPITNGEQYEEQQNDPESQKERDYDDTVDKDRDSPPIREDTRHDVTKETIYEPVEPEDFDTKSFLYMVDELTEKVGSDKYRNLDQDFDPDELQAMVHAVTVSMNNYKNYSMNSQEHLEKLREQMKDVKDRMYKRIHNKAWDPKSAKEKKGLDERQFDAKLAQLNKDMARTAEEILRAIQITEETEQSAVEAALVADQAAEEALRIQEEYEKRRKEDAIARREAEEKKRREEEKRKEQEERMERMRQEEEERRARLKRGDDASRKAVWESWPTHSYQVEAGDSTSNLGCMVRGNPDKFTDSMLKCEVVDPLDSTFTYDDNEELVSNIINISPAHGDEVLREPIFVLIPHNMTRASAMSREPVIKGEQEKGVWKELNSQEVTIEGHKDQKFVQAEVTSFCSLAVVTRYKRDFLQMPKRGGKVVAGVDARVTFSAERNTFRVKENFMMQLQPVDSATVNDIRYNIPGGANLLTSSAIVSLEWASEEFAKPITMTLPCPPNPVKAKKAAAARAAKEAKRNNPKLAAVAPPPETGKKKTKKEVKKKVEVVNDDDEEVPQQKVTKWYMGQYGANEDDENDILYFLRKTKSGKWHVMESISIQQVKLDLIQFSLEEPIDKFLVLRTRVSTEPKDAQHLADIIEEHLRQRVVNIVLRQHNVDPTDCVLHIVQQSPDNQKQNKLIGKLDDQGYSDGPGVSPELVLHEGDILELGFRGNITMDSRDSGNLNMVFNSQLSTSLSFAIQEVDKYLQRSYDHYRGFVQIHKKIPLEPEPREPQKKDSVKHHEHEDGEHEEDAEEEEEAEPEVQYEKELFSEHLISIPKLMDSTPKPIRTAPVTLLQDDPVTEDTLRHLSREMGDEWQRVAYYLNIRKERIQAIIRNNMLQDDKTEEDVKFDVLLSWRKKLPRGADKVEILQYALHMGGRDDLADDMRELKATFDRKKKTHSATRPSKSRSSTHGSRTASRTSVRNEHY